MFNFSWVLGSSGKLFSLAIFPEIETYIIKFFITFIILALTFVIYKIVFIYNKFDKTRYSFIMGVILAAFWFYLTENLILSLLWFIVTYFSPILSVVSISLILLSNNIETSFLKPFILLSMASNFIYSIFSYLDTNNEKEIWQIFTVGSLNVLFIATLFASFYLFLVVIMIFLFGSEDLINYLIINTLSGIITLVLYKKLTSFFNLLAAFINIILPASIIMTGVFLSLKDVFFVNSGCYIVDVEVVGFFALIIIIPVINSIFDYISYFVSKALIVHLSEISPKKTKWFLSFIFIHIVFDIILAVTLLLGLAILLLFILKYYFEYTATQSCGGVDLGSFVNLIKDTPISLDTTWIIIMLLTTLIPTLIHTVTAVIALIRNIVPRFARYRAITFLRSETNEPSELLFTSSLFAFTFLGAFVIVLTVLYALVSVLIFLFKYLLLDIYNISMFIVN